MEAQTLARPLEESVMARQRLGVQGGELSDNILQLNRPHISKLPWKCALQPQLVPLAAEKRHMAQRRVLEASGPCCEAC